MTKSYYYYYFKLLFFSIRLSNSYDSIKKRIRPHTHSRRTCRNIKFNNMNIIVMKRRRRILRPPSSGKTSRCRVSSALYVYEKYTPAPKYFNDKLLLYRIELPVKSEISFEAIKYCATQIK